MLFEVDTQVLLFRFYNKIRRLHNFFPRVNSLFVKQTITKIENGLTRLKGSLESPLFAEHIGKIDNITSQILTKDDSSLFFSEIRLVMDINGEALLQELFERLVTCNVDDEDRASIQDHEVWTKIYRPYFEKAKFTPDLKEAVVKTKHDEFHFEKTFRNGALHCFEPVSFQLSSSEIIRRKAYTWAGRLQELETSDENVKVYLLAAMPDDPKLRTLLEDKFSNKQIGKATIELIDEKHAELAVRQVEKLLDDHY